MTDKIYALSSRAMSLLSQTIVIVGFMGFGLTAMASGTYVVGVITGVFPPA